MDANEQLEEHRSDGSVFAGMEAEPRKLPPCGRRNRLSCFRAHEHSCCLELKRNDYSLTPEHLLLPGQVGRLPENTSRFWHGTFDFSASVSSVICVDDPLLKLERRGNETGNSGVAVPRVDGVWMSMREHVLKMEAWPHYHLFGQSRAAAP